MSKDCMVQLPNYSDLETWIRFNGGRNAVAKMFGKDPSTVHRWLTGEQETPKYVSQFIKLSEQNAELRQKLSRYKRRFGEL